MCENQAGRPPSRAHAQVSLEADAILPRVTAVDTTSKPDTMAVAALTEPVACVQISTIGNVAFTAASRSPRKNNITNIIAYARRPFRATVQNMARGTAWRALRTSSDMCTAPSNPGTMVSHLHQTQWMWTNSRPTNKTPSWCHQSHIEGYELIAPSRRADRLGKNEFCTVPRRKSH